MHQCTNQLLYDKAATGLQKDYWWRTNHPLSILISLSTFALFFKGTTAKNNNIGGSKVWETICPKQHLHTEEKLKIKLDNSPSKCETQVAAFKAFEVGSHLFRNLLWKIDEKKGRKVAKLRNVCFQLLRSEASRDSFISSKVQENEWVIFLWLKCFWYPGSYPTMNDHDQYDLTDWFLSPGRGVDWRIHIYKVTIKTVWK